jgi:hypothetical protein
MNITRNVILDLLPLYLAKEVSEDTKALVEEYLESDPELANASKKLAPLEQPAEVPDRISQDAEMRAYRKAKWMQLVIILSIAGAVTVFLLITLAIFFLTPS